MSRSKMLPSKCRKICLKDPAERTHDEILAMRSYMIGLKSFELYPPRMQNALCRVVRFEAFGRGRVIVRFGAIGSSMYFIRHGFYCFHTFLRKYLFVELDTEIFSKTIKVLEKLASQKIPVVMVSLHKRNQFLSNVAGALARLLLPINVPVLQQSFAWNTRNCLSLTKKISIISS